MISTAVLPEEALLGLVQGIVSYTFADTDFIVRLSVAKQAGQADFEPVPHRLGTSAVPEVTQAEQEAYRLLFQRVLQGERFTDLATGSQLANSPRLMTEYYPVYSNTNQITGLAIATRWLGDAPALPGTSSATRPESDFTTGQEEILAGHAQALNEDTAQLKAALLASEKQAMLGRLLSGVAHELNTPLGAILAGATNLSEAYTQWLAGLRYLIGQRNTTLWQQIETALQAIELAKPLVGSSEKRKAVRLLEARLDDLEVGQPYELAQKLIDLGLQDQLSRIEPLLSPSNTKAFAFLENLGQIRQNAANLQQAAQKGNKLVRALREYNASAPATENYPVDVAANIENLIALYHNELKYGIELELKLLPDTYVVADADRLGQVWSNLLQNAIQAMDKKGKLVIESHQKGNFLQVDISDSGPGIPTAIAEKIFQPFFSTKRGQGTGLGLSISKEIVEGLGGTLCFNTGLGRTTFTVTLPLLVR